MAIAMRASTAPMRRINFWIVALSLAVTALLGGSARDDVIQLLVLRPLIVIALVMLLVMNVQSADWRPVRVPLILLAIVAIIAFMQMIPLPPGIWFNLPGHGQFRAVATTAGLQDVWRPLSLTPDRTLTAVIDLLPPALFLYGMACLTQSQRGRMLWLVLAVVAASAMLGILQVGQGPNGSLYPFATAHQGFPVGLFANRNHQAALLAITLPLLRVVVELAPVPPRHLRQWRAAVAMVALLVIVLLLLTSSRAGIALGGVGLVASYFVAPLPRERLLQRKVLVSAGVVVGVLAALLATVMWQGRDLSIARLMSTDLSAELRTYNTPYVLELIRQYFPLGSGLGSFESIFKIIEPDATLRPTYYNHAHNDFLEVAVTGGVATSAIVLAFLIWYFRRTFHMFRPTSRRTTAFVLPRAGAAMLLILMLASAVDYPLRTPLMASIAALACAWLAYGPTLRTKRMRSA